MALPSLNEEKPASFYPFETSLGMKGKGKKDNSEVGSNTARYGDEAKERGREGGRERGRGREGEREGGREYEEGKRGEGGGR